MLIISQNHIYFASNIPKEYRFSLFIFEAIVSNGYQIPGLKYLDLILMYVRKYMTNGRGNCKRNETHLVFVILFYYKWYFNAVKTNSKNPNTLGCYWFEFLNVGVCYQSIYFNTHTHTRARARAHTYKIFFSALFMRGWLFKIFVVRY